MDRAGLKIEHTMHSTYNSVWLTSADRDVIVTYMTYMPQVVQHGERGWRMWYTGNGFGRTGMGFAEGVEELTEAVGSYPPNAGLQLSTSANTGTST